MSGSGSMKLAFVITGDASGLKAAASSGKAAVVDLGSAAVGAGAGLAQMSATATAATGAATKTAEAVGKVANANRSLKAEIERSAGVMGETFGPMTQANAKAYAQQLDAIRAKYDPLFAAAQRQKAILAEIAQAETAGALVGAAAIQARLRAVTEYNNALSAQASKPAQAKAAAESLVGGRTVTPDRAADIAAYGKQLDELRAKHVPLFAAGQQYKAQLAEIRKDQNLGAISATEAAAAIERTKTAFASQVTELNRVAKGSGFAAHEIGNLRSQAIDIGTMFSMGASPFQIISSQAGQIYEVLANAKGGVTGAFKAMGTAIAGAATAIGPWGLALAGVTATIGVLAYTFREKVEPIEDIIARQEKAVLALERAYKIAGVGAEDYGRRATSSLKADNRDNQQEALKRIQAETEDQVASSFSGLPNKYRRTNGEFAELRGAIEDFIASVKAGDPDFATFDKRLGDIRQKAGDTGEVSRLAKEWKTFGDTIAPLAAVVERTGKALSQSVVDAMQAREKLAKLNGDMGQYLAPDLSEAQDVERIYRERMAALAKSNSSPRAREGLSSQYDRERNDALRRLNQESLENLMETEGRREDITKSSTARQISEIERGYERRIAAARKAGKTDTEISNLQKAQANEVATVTTAAAQAETARRAGYELDLRAIGARTAAQKASIAADRAQADAIAQNLGPTEALRRAEEARSLSMAQSREGLAESTRSQTEATRRQVEQAQLEYDLVGKSAGETARLRAEYEMLTQARQAAESAGYDASTVMLTDAMREQAGEIGRLTEATQRLNFERDLLFDRQQSTRSPEEQRIAEQLRAIGVEYESVQGKQDAAQLRLNNRLHETNDAFYEMRDAGKDAFLDIADAIGSSKGALDGLLGVADSLFKKFASAGAEKLFNWISGTGAGGAASGSTGIIGTLGAVANNVVSTVQNRGGGVPVPTARPEYVASVASAAAASSGSMMTYASRFNNGVDSRLMKILETAASRFDGYKVEAISGLASRPGNRGFHPKGMAADVQITNATTGKVYDNYQNAADFRVYEQYAQLAKVAQRELYPALEKLFTFGGYLQGPKGHYGALDSMHFDIGGANRMRGGSFENGLTAKQRGYFPGVESVGMGALGAMSKSDYQRTLSKSTQTGVETGLKNVVRDTPASTSQGDGQQRRQLTGGQQAIAGIGGLIGAFSGGYQSGSPVSGALNGAMGGFEVGSSLSFLGAAGGPIGAGIGAVAGILGGILGKRKQKKQEEKEAKRQWEGMQPQYEAYRRYLSGEESGNLRTDFQNIQAQFNTFQQASVKAKNGDLASTARTFYEYVTRQLTEFRDAFSDVARDLADGAGMNGPFTKGKSSVRQLQKELLAFLDDVEIAYMKADNGLARGAPGDAAEKAWADERAKAVATAQQAAQTAALSVLNPAEELSAVTQNFRSLQGAAQQLVPTLIKLGMEAGLAGKRVDEELTKAVAKMRTDFETSISEQINELSDKGYLNEAKDALKGYETQKADASLIGADSSRLPELFKLQAQAIVDGAELTGDAFAELIKAFPELSGVVTEFEEKVKRTSKGLKDAIAGYDDRVFAASNDNSTVAGQLAAFDRQAQKDREAEVAAGGGALVQLEKALTAERVKIARDGARQLAKTVYDAASSPLQSLYESLSSFSTNLKDFLSDMKLGPTSTLSAKDQVAEARKVYEETLAKANAGDGDARDKLLAVAQTYLEKDKAYNVSSPAYVATFEKVQAELTTANVKATSQLDLMRSSASWLAKINDNTLTVAQALKDYLAAEKTLNAGREWGVMAAQNKAIVKDLSATGINYTGDFGNGRFLEWVAAQLPSQQAIINAIIQKNRPIGMQLGGVVGAYANGGRVGNGTWNVDSVRARYAGGGDIALAGGEFVVPAPRVTPQTMPLLEGLRAGRMPGNDNADLIAAIGRLEALLRTNVLTTGRGLDRVAAAGLRTAGFAEQQALAARRTISKGAQAE